MFPVFHPVMGCLNCGLFDFEKIHKHALECDHGLRTNILGRVFMTIARASAAETRLAYGVFPADEFRITTGEYADCATIPQVMWYFRPETIAIPKPFHPLVLRFTRPESHSE
jgi:hypothetical protein